MKFADSVKQTANLTSTATITLGAAAVGFRTWAQAIADTAGKPEQVTVGDTVCNRVDDVTDPGKWEVADYTIGGTAQAPTLTRGTIRTSSNAGAAVVFGGPVTVLCTVPSNHLAGLLSSANGTTLAQLSGAGQLAGANVFLVSQDGGATVVTTTLTAIAAAVAAINGTGSSSVASTVSGVTVSPTTASIAGAATQQFTASVAGTNSPSQGVTWSTNLGTVTTGGLYTAPAATASVQTATITATSTQDGTKAGTATVTIAATGAASTYTVRKTNATGGINGSNFLTTGTINGGSATTDGYAGFTPAVYILDASGNAPANGTSILFAWGASPTSPPTLTADVPPRVAVGQMHNAVAESNTTAVGAPQGGWAAKGDGYYGLYSTGANFFVYTEKPGTAVNAYLWTQVGSIWVVFTDATGTPIPYVLT